MRSDHKVKSLLLSTPIQLLIFGTEILMLAKDQDEDNFSGF